MWKPTVILPHFSLSAVGSQTAFCVSCFQLLLGSPVEVFLKKQLVAAQANEPCVLAVGVGVTPGFYSRFCL